MEGIQFQYQSSPRASKARPYPLSLDERLTQGDRYREAAQQLDTTLRDIDQFSNAQAHTGGYNCAPCAEKNRRIKHAFYEYYLGEQPGRWDDKPVHRREMQEYFNYPIFELQDIHQRFKNNLSSHLRNDMCTVLPIDGKDTADLKMRLQDMFRELTLEEALSRGFQEKIQHLATMPGLEGQVSGLNTENPTHPAAFNIRLQSTKNNEERANLYTAYYCTPGPEDPPLLRNLKQKYAKHFESGLSHDTVLAMWKAEVEDTGKREVDVQEQRLSELKYAQSAHLKAKKKKVLKEDAKTKEHPTHVVECNLPGCGRQMDKSKEEAIECAVCDWLSRRTGQKRRSYYCSQDHNDMDFYEHDRHEHSCSMDDQCYYYMDLPELEACGICSDCLGNGTVSFFCSQECYSQTHRDDVHYDGGDGGGFINFRRVSGLELTS